MTGKHCGECSDPIFRYDGQEFCPTCQQEAQSGGSQTEAPEAADDQSMTDAAHADEQSPTEAQPSATADHSSADENEPRVEIDGISVADQHADRSNLRQPPSQQDGSDERAQSGGHARDSTSRTRGHSHEGDTRGHSRHEHDPRAGRETASRTQRTPEAGDLGVAREALVRNLTDLARRAEETDDATHTRELLAATREAAEALAALDRVHR